MYRVGTPKFVVTSPVAAAPKGASPDGVGDVRAFYCPGIRHLHPSL